MERLKVDEFLRTYAPPDVANTVAWLSANGYALVSEEGDASFGAQLIYTHEAEVRITVDRSQWYLDVAPTPASNAWQYDVLLAAHSGRDYGALFPEAGSRSFTHPLPEQLPAGVSWRDTLPDILEWVRGEDVAEAAERANRQRTALMWHKE